MQRKIFKFRTTTEQQKWIGTQYQIRWISGHQQWSTSIYYKNSDTQEFTYNPITLELQKRLSANLSIQNENIPETFPKLSNVMLGKSVQTSEIISDGNCFFGPFHLH